MGPTGWAPPRYRALDVVPKPPPYTPPYATPPNTSPKAFRELVMGSAIHTALAATVAGGIGFAIAGPVGALRGAVVGTALGQAFMQFLARMADGGGAQAPLVAALPTVASVGAAIAAKVFFGATAGACAWLMIGVPIAVLAATYLWHQQAGQTSYPPGPWAS